MTHPRKIVAAAIRNKYNDIILGVRHYDRIMHRQIRNRQSWTPAEVTQGFVDNQGNFLDRFEAWAVATAAGQCSTPPVPGGTKLYSGDLW